MLKKIFIVVSVLLMIILVFIFGFKTNESKYNVFQEEGYIITSSIQNDNITSAKQYFNTDTKYKNNYENQIVFNNTDNEEVKIDNNSFVHYANGSISVLKKTAILNLNSLLNQNNSSIITYYNLYATSILTKKGETYNIQSNNQNISFSTFLIKSSENKFILVAPKMTLHIGDVTKELTNNFIEITIFDGKIVRLENQEVVYQNASKEMYIDLENNIKINLTNQNIYLGNESVLNLSEITINNDDNIEIPVEEENTEIKKDDDDENNSTNNNQTPSENPIGGMNNGIVNPGNSNNNEEEVNEHERLTDPVFTITDLTVTSNKFEANIQVEDQDSLLENDITVKIIETSNNKTVYQTRYPAGSTTFDVSVENLTPEKNYAFVVTSSYTKNDNKYEKDFIQRTFVTESIGLEVEKNYFTTNTLSFHLILKQYSRVKQVDATLLLNGEVIKTIPVTLEDEKTEITYTGLEKNKEYTLVIKNFLYDNAIISNDFNIEQRYKTLKEKPIIGNTSFTIDKRNSLFNLKVNNISDPDNGIKKYRYEIYDARNITIGNPIQVIEKDTKTSVDLQIDNALIQRNTPYTYRLVAIFDDNEKEYEYSTEMSATMKMDGVEFPKIRFEEQEVTFERIEGNIIISDEGNTIDFNDGSLITVAYTDSSGNTTSFTTSGNMKIPFNVNNLRKNETYTIYVYAKVNLQDGNESIDNCYIGSVVVKTKDTNALTLSYIINEDVTEPFSATARLNSSSNEIDTTLEANTLSSMVFNLYQGRSTSGSLVKSVRKVDRNTDYYVSQLKEEYYDKTFEIDPSFFGLKNNDLKAEYYTIEVTNAYDYTTYKNEIPITNNIFTVKTNGYIPDLPTDTTNAVDMTVIRNKDAKDHYRSDLKADTIVGYNIKANYDNSNKYAKSIVYNIHNAITDEIVETYTYNVENDGSINYLTVYLKDGTSYERTDTEFRRGNEYYFSYSVYLDLNLDGNVDTIYPINSNIVLKSKTITPEKELPTVYMYPSESTESTFAWKYLYQDIDYTIIDNKFYYQIDGNEKGTVSTSKSSKYQVANFANLTPGILNIYQKIARIKTDENITENTLVNQYFEGIYKPSDSSYSLTLESNRIIITFLDYRTNEAFFRRVSGAKLVFTANGKTITLDRKTIDNGLIVVDLSDIAEFINSTINLDVLLYYDTGVSGFDLTGDYFAMQMITNSLYDGLYYSFDSNMIFQTSSSAMKSLFQFNWDLENTTLTLKDLYKDQSNKLLINLDQSGVSYNYEYFMMKKEELISVNSDGSNTFAFDMIIPGVSLLDEENNLSIVPALTTANVKINLYGNANSQIKDNKVYIELYKTNESATQSELVKTLEISTNDLSSITLENLEIKTNYYIKLLADVYDGENYVRTQLYDIDFQSNSKIYYFKTLGTVGVSNINITYGATSYDDKYLTLNYDLKEIIRYDRIDYEVYKIIPNNDNPTYEKIELGITSDYVFKKEMSKKINIAPGSGVEANYNYLIKIRAYKTITADNVETDVELIDENEAAEIEYHFAQLILPYIGVTSTRSGSDSVQFKVNFYDYRRTVVNDAYKIRILDAEGTDITPEEYKNEQYSTKKYSQTFTLNGVKENEKYEFRVLYRTNNLNGLDTFDSRVKTYTTTIRKDTDIYIGSIDVIADNIDQNRIKLVFYDSNKLTNITRIRYSIYSDNDYAIDNELSFTPTLVTSTGLTYYTFVLQEYLQTSGIYYIQLQFLNENGVVEERSLEYNYVE